MAKKKVLIGDHIYGPLVIEYPLFVGPLRRFHIDGDIDLLGKRDPQGSNLMTVIKKIATDTGVQLTAVNGHRFDVVPADPDDLSTVAVNAFGRRLRANEASMLKALQKG